MVCSHFNLCHLMIPIKKNVKQKRRIIIIMVAFDIPFSVNKKNIIHAFKTLINSKSNDTTTTTKMFSILFSHFSNTSCEDRALASVHFFRFGHFIDPINSAISIVWVNCKTYNQMINSRNILFMAVNCTNVQQFCLICDKDQPYRRLFIYIHFYHNKPV